VPTELVIDMGNASQRALVPLAQLTAWRMEAVTLRLTGRRLHRWRIDNGSSVPDMSAAPVDVAVRQISSGGATGGSRAVNNDRTSEAIVPAHRLARGRSWSR
jgi:hypothetical protein